VFQPLGETPAFPVEGVSNGLTLRQYYAAKIMAGLAADLPEEFVAADIAETAFMLADALLYWEDDNE
jgi:hypothetical protein